MKTFLLFVLCFCLINANAQTQQNPYTLTLNGSGSGNIGSSTASQWWQLTTNADGALIITIQAPAYDQNGHYRQVTWVLYDHDKTHNLIYGGNDPIRFGNPGSYAFDGLAKGTYYIRVTATDPNDTADHTTYTLSNVLVKPKTLNDAEPDSTKATALILPLNDSVQGHVGYLYNNHRDSVDWYKVTTNADGYLRLTIKNEITTQQLSNGYTFNHNGGLDIAILDHDGTTTLKAYSSDFGYPIVFGVDGLAPGTYYISVHPRGSYQLNGADGGGYYYSTVNFTPYTIADSLFKPSVANDAEPDSNKATALTLPLNGSIKGHIGYYYNHYLDTADFYKVVTNKDGKLNITITPQQTQANNQSNNLALQCWLYDKDGKTQLLYGNAGALNQISVSRDGLAAGTYYLRIQPFNNYTDLACCGGGFDTRLAFGPYIISNTLDTYTYVNDKEPDSLAKQASTILTNKSNTGHINFTGNGNHDLVDWVKINYTGVNGGTIKLIYQLQHHLDNEYGNAIFQLYRDTTTGLTYTELSGTDQQTITFNNAQQGYYYLKVTPASTDRFCIYSITDSFTQVNKAHIQFVKADTAADCSLTNSLTYKCSGSHSPYTIRLYRFDSLYEIKNVNNSNNFTIDSLPDGIYYATAYGDGATGNAYSKSDTVSLMPVPANLRATNITSTTAKLNWTKLDCAAYYTVRYRRHGAAIWTNRATNGNKNYYVLANLKPGAKYDCSVAAVDADNNIIDTGMYTNNISFTTAATLFAGDNNEEDLSVNDKANITSMFISPNPANSFFIIHFNDSKAQKLNAILYDATGKAVWNSGLINADALNNKQVNVSQFAKGIFYLKVADENGVDKGSIKIIIAY